MDVFCFSSLGPVTVRLTILRKRAFTGLILTMGMNIRICFILSACLGDVAIAVMMLELQWTDKPGLNHPRNPHEIDFVIGAESRAFCIFRSLWAEARHLYVPNCYCPCDK